MDCDGVTLLIKMLVRGEGEGEKLERTGFGGEFRFAETA